MKGRIRLSKGFTLVEIMIVIAIIGLLAAVAIPGLLRARLNANENTAKSNLRQIRDAAEQYRMAQTALSYPPDLDVLTTATPPYIDSALAGATSAPGKQGYYFTYTLVNASQYTAVATPDNVGATGNNTFFVDETGVIRYTNAGGNPID